VNRIAACVFAWLAAALLAGCATADEKRPGAWAFGIIGDTPYSETEEAALEPVIDEINREDLAFVVHIGDIKSGGSRCSDELYQDRKVRFQRIRHPFVLLPGDNEWTDCHRASAGGYDPLERLAALRRIFHAGDLSLGERPLPLARQSQEPRYRAYRENVRWIRGDIAFVGINVPGSNNNLGRTPAANAEHRERMSANFAWLDEAFRIAAAKELAAVVIMTQANPGLDFLGILRLGKPDGYAELRTALVAHALAFGKPVLFVHGDTHTYRVDHPFNDPATGIAIGNLKRLETFGSPRTNWVKVTVGASDTQLFSIRPGAPPQH
jgi:hypothetical protein